MEPEPEQDDEWLGDGQSPATDRGIRQYKRLEAVRSQLEMAVRALFEFDDPVSALTLVGAAERVLRDIQPKDAKLSEGFNTVKAFCNEMVRPEARRRVTKSIDFNYDQLRHADKRPQHLHVINVEGLEMFILTTVWAYAGKPKGDPDAFAEWFNALPHSLSAFVVWMFLNYPSDTWDKRPDDDFPELKLARSNLPQAFRELLDLVQSKSLFPDPKSLEGSAR